MSGQPHTIDSIAHALPHPEQRATFMRDVSFTPVDQLPARLERWIKFIDDIESGRVKAREVGAYFAEHGRLPDEYQEESEESRAAFHEWEQRMQALREGRNVA